MCFVVGCLMVGDCDGRGGISVCARWKRCRQCACKWWGWYMSAFVHVLVSLSAEWECVFVCVVAHAHRLLLFVR